MPDEPDYFDRLLARQLPTDAVPGRVRVRPRLPGPFERAEGRWTELVEGETLPPLLPPASPVPAPLPSVVPPIGPWSPAPDPRPSAGPRGDTAALAVPGPETSPVLRPAADVSPPPRAVTSSAPKRPDQVPGPAPSARDDGAGPPARPSPAPDPASGPAGPPRAVPPRIVPPARRRAAGPPAARTQAAATPEQPSVQVRIGRLEVRTAEPERRPARSVNGGRRAPAVDLSGYLSSRDSGAAS